MSKKLNIEANTLRVQTSHRGGGIEISLDHLGKKYKGGKMTAYQNYLGGGMLGSIASDCNIEGWSNDETLLTVSEALKEYFHDLTNPDDEFDGMSFERRQKMPHSAY